MGVDGGAAHPHLRQQGLEHGDLLVLEKLSYLCCPYLFILFSGIRKMDK
jgi:hypothetical protein